MAEITPENIKSKAALSQAMRDIQRYQGISADKPTQFSRAMKKLMFTTSSSDNFHFKHPIEAFDKLYKSIDTHIKDLNKLLKKKRGDDGEDEEGYVERLTDPKRFTRIYRGTGTSGLKMDLLDKAEISDQRFAREIKNGPLLRNLWYYMVPFIGEGANHVYNMGPGEARDAEGGLWDVLFDQPFDSRHYIFKSQSYLRCHPALQSNQSQSGENLAEFVIGLIQNTNPKFVYFKYDQSFFKYCIAIIRLAKLEQSVGGSNYTNYSSQLLDIVISHPDIKSVLAKYRIEEDVVHYLEKLGDPAKRVAA